jgi:hypothetical protein
VDLLKLNTDYQPSVPPGRAAVFKNVAFLKGRFGKRGVFQTALGGF